MANGTGVIDSDYCGPEDEIFLLLENLRDEPILLQAGDRVCQALVIPVLQGLIEEVQEMTGLNRGGHGSTGQ
jgi:dUTP pyrophosphatase